MTDDRNTMFHEGHRELQDRFDGRRLADALEHRYRFDAFRQEDIDFIQDAEFFFLATAHGDSVDCSFKGGAPGFVRVTGPTSLEWPDYDGNSMYRSLGNLARSPRAGLLFIRFGLSPARLRVNGVCTLAETESGKLLIQMSADEIFPNCPRYVPDIASGVPSRYIPNGSDAGPKPGWKNHDEISAVLPNDDPHLD